MSEPDFEWPDTDDDDAAADDAAQRGYDDAHEESQNDR